MSKYKECQRPFSPCWCETRPKNPHCKNVPSVPIESDFFSILILFLIVVFLAVRHDFKFRKKLSDKPKLRMTPEELKKLNHVFNEVNKKDSDYLLKFLYVFLVIGIIGWVAFVIHVIKQSL